jgi:integral membrane protein
MTPLLRWYRAVAYTVGTLLILLLFVGVPLQIWAHNKTVVFIVGAAHGWLYLVYLVLTVLLAFRYRFPPLRVLLSFAAGLVPVTTFVAEHSNQKFVQERLAASTPAGATAPSSASAS